MTSAALYNLLYWVWITSEVLILLRTRTSKDAGEVRDRGSLRVLWVTITMALTLGAWAGAVHPLVMFGGARWVRVTSLAVFAAGLAVRWASIASLGKSFSANVAILTTQTLHTTGLYRLVRHPSYTGLLLVLMAIALHPANWTTFWITLLPAFAALLYRIHVEEKALNDAFGDEYRAYARHTKRLVPFVY